MHILRGLLFVILGLILISLVTILFLAPNMVVDLGQSLIALPIITRIVIVIILDLLILGVLYLQLRSPNHATEGLIVRVKGGSALADVSTESARERVLAAVRAVPNVVSAEAKLEAINGNADIDMEVVVSGLSVNVPEKQREIDRALRQVIEKQLGLRLAGRPRVHLQLQTEKPLVTPAPIAPPVVAPVIEITKDEPLAETVTPVISDDPVLDDMVGTDTLVFPPDEVKSNFDKFSSGSPSSGLYDDKESETGDSDDKKKGDFPINTA